MVPALLSNRSQLLRTHMTVGASTCYMEAGRGYWPDLVAEAASVSSVAAELSAISEPELPDLLEFLTSAPRLPFRYVSVHAPSKQRVLAEDELVELLMRHRGARRFVADLAGVMTLAADPSPQYPAVCRDPGDDNLVALARVAVVDARVTGDRELLEVGDVGVPVITPRELVERLADAR